MGLCVVPKCDMAVGINKEDGTLTQAIGALVLGRYAMSTVDMTPPSSSPPHHLYAFRCHLAMNIYIAVTAVQVI